MANPQKRSRYDWLLEIISLVALLWAFYPLFFYGRIGEDMLIPIHYNVAGEIDGWGGRHFLWIIPLIALVFYIGLSLFEKFYKRAGYTLKATEKNAQYLYRQRVRFSRHMKVLSLLVFACLNNSSYAIAIGKGSGLNRFVIILLMGGLLLSVLIFYVRMNQGKDTKQ